jgi:hypothetical protein
VEAKMDEASLRVALEELRAQNASAMAAGDALDQKANFLFAGESVLFGIAAGVAVARGSQLACAWGFWLAAGIIVALYIGSTLSFIVGIAPKKYMTAVKPQRETLEKELLLVSGEEAMLALVERYLETIAHNRGVNKGKIHSVRISGGLLCGIVAAIVAMAILGI